MGFASPPPALKITGGITVTTVTSVGKIIETTIIQSPPAASILQPATSIVSSQNLAGTGAPKQITGTGVPLYGVVLKAERANTSPVYIGGSNVTDPDSYKLTPGETLNLPPLKVTLLWFIAGTTTALEVWSI